MAQDSTNTSAIFASNLLNSLGNARTLNGLTSDNFMQINQNSSPLNDNSIILGDETHRYKNIWTLGINAISIDTFAKKNKSYIPTLNDTFTLGDGNHNWRQIFVTEARTEKIITNEIQTSDNKLYSHTKLSDIGSNSHADIDEHIGAFTLVHGATSQNVANRIVIRDFNGNFSAGTISAKLGDLAENYTTDSIEKVGTVYCVSKCYGQEVEVCNEEFCKCIVGVVSDKPGYIMSSEIDGVTLGIKGKLPVRVIGPVKKGDWLGSAGHGVAFVTTKIECKFAIALEENMDMDEKLVMAVL